MSQEGGLTLFASFLAFGVISISFYLLVLRPILPSDNPAGRAGVVDPVNNAANNRNNRVAPRARGAQDQGAAAAAAAATTGATNDANSEDSNIRRMLVEVGTCPPHVAENSQAYCRVGGANLLVDGLLAFRHSKAASFEQSMTPDGDILAQNRKDRARVLSQMLNLEEKDSSSSSSPPQRGSTLVVSIPCAEVSCSKLRRVLYLFATYYNLLVILVVPPSTKTEELKEYITKLRGSGNELLGPDVLPDHRIVAASTATGRVAFVRQLVRTEVVLDFDIEVKNQLSRFGYRVIRYGDKKSTSDAKSVSQLGSQLLS